MDCTYLKEYLRKKEEGGFGWLAEYGKNVAGSDGGVSFPYLCGHYSMLLSQVLDLVPPRLLEDAIRAAESHNS